MKTQMVLWLLLSVTLTARAKTVEIPMEVQTAFHEKFSETIKTKWKQSKNGDFVARFKTDAQTVNATFSKEGVWLKTETTLQIEKCPSVIIKTLRAKYPESDLNDIKKVEAKDAMPLYFATLISQNSEIEVRMDEKGKILGTQKKVIRSLEQMDSQNYGNDNDAGGSDGGGE